MRKLMTLVMVLMLVLTAGIALAATQTSNITVSANVSGNCRITGTNNIVFATAYDPADNAADNDSGAGSFLFRCTKGTVYDLYITGNRQMTDGVDNLNFQIYSDAGRTLVYPAANPGAANVAASNNEQTVNVYGRIPMLQNVGVGAYSATLVVTVEY